MFDTHWWLPFEMPLEVRAAIIAGIVSLVGAVFLFGFKAFNLWAEARLNRLRADLANHSAQYGQTITEGVPNAGAVPVEKLAEVVYEAKKYALEANPKEAQKLQDFDKRMIARLDIEDAPKAVIEAAAKTGNAAADQEFRAAATPTELAATATDLVKTASDLASTATDLASAAEKKGEAK